MGNTWKVVVAFVGVFVAGTVFGGFFALGVGQRLIQARSPSRPPTDPMLLRRYVQGLDLTEVQTTKIKPILDKIQSDVDEIRRQANLDTAAVLRPIVEKAEADIKKNLTPEQIAKLDVIQKSRGLMLDGQGRGGRGGGPQNGPSNFSRGGGGRGDRGGFNPNGGRGSGFPDRSAQEPRPSPVEPKSSAPAGN